MRGLILLQYGLVLGLNVSSGVLNFYTGFNFSRGYNSKNPFMKLHFSGWLKEIITTTPNNPIRSFAHHQSSCCQPINVTKKISLAIFLDFPMEVLVQLVKKNDVNRLTTGGLVVGEGSDEIIWCRCDYFF